MYRVYNLPPRATTDGWVHDNKRLMIGLIFWSLLVAAVADSQQVSSDGWYTVISLEGALVTLRMPDEKSCKADLSHTCIPGYELRAQRR